MAALSKRVPFLHLVHRQVRGFIALKEHSHSENINANLNALTLLRGPSL